MDNFDFCSPTRFIFGKNVEEKVGETVKSFGGSRVLIQYGGGSAVKSGLLDRVTSSLDAAGVSWVTLGDVRPNPRLSLVREAIALCRAEKADMLLAVGGGSVIDSVKATALGACYDGDVWDFYEGKTVPEKILPLGTVLTMAAAGSEGSNSSVITNEEGNLKRGLGCELTRPLFSLMNPELTYTVPAYQTAAGAVDILAHVMERYFTNTPNVELSDRMSEGLMRAVLRNAPIAIAEPDNYAARAELMWASTLAHNNLLGVGRETDFASHQIEHELSGLYDVAHGAGLAAIFPSWMRFVYKRNVPRFVRFATRVMGVEGDPFDIEGTALAGITALEKFYLSIGMPITLTQLGIPGDRLEEMARKVKKHDPVTGTTGHFVPLTEEDCLAILKAAL